MARPTPKPLTKGIPLDLDAVRRPPKAPDIDPVVIPPSSAHLAAVPSAESGADEPAERELDNAPAEQDAARQEAPQSSNGENSGVSETQELPPQSDLTVSADHGEPATAGGGAEPAEAADPPEPRARPTKITIGLQPAEAARVRAAYMNLPAKHRPRSLSAFAAVPLMDYVRQIEERYNDGQPFEPIEAGEIPTGRPLGS